MSSRRNKIHLALRRAFGTAALLSQTAAALPAPARSPVLPADTVDDVQNLLDATQKARPNPLYNRYIAIDPYAIDKAMAAGQNGEDAVAAYFAGHGYPRPDPVWSLAFAMATEYVTQSPLGTSVVSVLPGAANIPGTRLCIVVPASGGLLNEVVSGLIPAIGLPRTIEFINRHEIWHCRDRSPPYKNYRNEAFADTAAVGDMIRGGAGMEVLDAVTNWREARAWDLDHWTSPVLKALKGEIGRMGLDRFRALGDDAAENLYHRVADRNGLSPTEAMNAFVLHRLFRDEEGRQTLRQQAKTDPAVAQGLALADAYAGLPQEATVTLPSPELGRRLEEWNAAARLRAKAQETGGGETSQTRNRAYDALRKELRARMDADPFNAYYAEQVLSLRTTFLLGSVSGAPKAATSAIVPPRVAATRTPEAALP
jgi:hypothetical protein